MPETQPIFDKNKLEQYEEELKSFLPKGEFEFLFKRYVDGKSNKEISEETKKTLNALRACNHALVKKLKPYKDDLINLPSRPKSPFSRAALKHNLSKIENILPQNTFEALVEYHITGKSFEEIAKETKKTIDTLRVLSSRAINKLKRYKNNLEHLPSKKQSAKTIQNGATYKNKQEKFLAQLEEFQPAIEAILYTLNNHHYDKSKMENMKHDVFLKLQKKIKEGYFSDSTQKNGEPASFSGWCGRVIRNFYIDQIRKDKKEKENLRKWSSSSVAVDTHVNQNTNHTGRVIQEDFENVSGSFVSNFSSPDSGDVPKLTNDFFWTIVRQALPKEQLDIVVDRFVHDLSFQEIAEKRDIKINTALTRMRYALIKLGKMDKKNPPKELSAKEKEKHERQQKIFKALLTYDAA